MAGSAAVSAEMSEKLGAVRQWPVPLKSKVSRARTSRGVPSLARRQDRCASDITAFRLEVEVRQRSVGRPGPRPDHSTSACQRDTVKADAQGSTAPAFGDRAAPRPRADAMVLELEARPSVPAERPCWVGVGNMPLDLSGQKRRLILGWLMDSDSMKRSAGTIPWSPPPIRLAARSLACSAPSPILDNRAEMNPRQWLP
jgi:hypothetical protein